MFPDLYQYTIDSILQTAPDLWIVFCMLYIIQSNIHNSSDIQRNQHLPTPNQKLSRVRLHKTSNKWLNKIVSMVKRRNLNCYERVIWANNHSTANIQFTFLGKRSGTYRKMDWQRPLNWLECQSRDSLARNLNICLKLDRRSTRVIL